MFDTFAGLVGAVGHTPISESKLCHKGIRMTVESCMPIIPSANLERSLRLWVDGLGFNMDSEMRADGKLTFCMLRRGNLSFMLNRRAGKPTKPERVCHSLSPIAGLYPLHDLVAFRAAPRRRIPL